MPARCPISASLEERAGHEDDRIQLGGCESPHKGRSPPDPVLLPEAGDHCRPESAGRVDAHRGDGTQEPHEQCDDQGDGQGLQVAPLGPAMNQFVRYDFWRVAMLFSVSGVSSCILGCKIPEEICPKGHISSVILRGIAIEWGKLDTTYFMA